VLLLFLSKHIFNCRHHRYFEILPVLTIVLQLAPITLQHLGIDELIILLRGAWRLGMRDSR